MTKALRYLFDTNEPMKSRLSFQVTEYIFHFFFFFQAVTVNDRLSTASRIKAATE